MVCVIILLLLVPGMFTWKIAGDGELTGWKDLGKAMVNWMIHDLVIICLVYASLYFMKGAVTVSFSTDYLGEEVYYSIYDISFVFRYSALAFCAATALGLAERGIVKARGGRRQ